MPAEILSGMEEAAAEEGGQGEGNDIGTGAESLEGLLEKVGNGLGADLHDIPYFVPVQVLEEFKIDDLFLPFGEGSDQLLQLLGDDSRFLMFYDGLVDGEFAIKAVELIGAQGDDPDFFQQLVFSQDHPPQGGKQIRFQVDSRCEKLFPFPYFNEEILDAIFHQGLVRGKACSVIEQGVCITMHDTRQCRFIAMQQLSPKIIFIVRAGGCISENLQGG